MVTRCHWIIFRAMSRHEDFVMTMLSIIDLGSQGQSLGARMAAGP